MGRATREVWAGRVERWRTSGLTAGEFARRLGVSDKSLRWWKWRLTSTARESRGPTQGHKKAARATKVSPLTFVEMTSPLRHEPIEIVLASGTRVVVPVDVDASALARVMDVLERRR